MRRRSQCCPLLPKLAVANREQSDRAACDVVREVICFYTMTAAIRPIGCVAGLPIQINETQLLWSIASQKPERVLNQLCRIDEFVTVGLGA